MAADEGFDDDGPEFHPPLPPEDRIWRHPAEFGAEARAASAVAPERSGGRSPWTVGFVSVIGGVLLASTLMFGAGGMGKDPGRIALQPIATLEPRADDGDDPSDLVGLDNALPAQDVVGIDVDTGTEVRSGNGITVAADGVVVTTASLVAGATEIRVTDDDGDSYTASVMSTDVLNDLAVLRVDQFTSTPVELDPEATAEADDPVQALGASRGVAQPSWSAVVAAVDVRVVVDQTDLHGALQLDHALDDTSAGAPVRTKDGELVGIVTTLGSNGPTYVIPNRTIAAVVDQVITTGTVRHGWLGIEGVNADEADGAHVRRVIDGSPAQVAGVLPDDLVVSVEGEAIESMGDLVLAIRENPPGTAITMGVTREGTLLTLEVALADAPATPDP